MNAPAQGRQTATPYPVAGSAAEARKLAENLMEVMSALLGVIERETELVRAGKLREAMKFEQQKSELSRRYASAVGHLKASQKYLSQAAPELLTTLHRHHDVFRSMLQINLTVLATAHAVSESVVRGVNAEMQRRNMPNTYTAAGQRAAPGPRHIAPLSRSDGHYGEMRLCLTGTASEVHLSHCRAIAFDPKRTRTPTFPRRHGRACHGHPRLGNRKEGRGCPGQARAR